MRDRPTPFLLKALAKRTSPCNIRALKRNNNATSEIDQMMEEGVRFYSQLFSEKTTSTDAQDNLLKHCSNKLTQLMQWENQQSQNS